MLLSSCGDPDQELADAGLLRIEDFPAGFRSLPAGDELPEGEGDDGPGACDAIETVTGVGTVVEAAAGPFANAETLVTNDVAVYRDPNVASQVLDVWTDEENALGCMELTLSAFVEIGTTDPFFDAAFGGYDVSAEPLEVGKIGDARAAWHGDLTLYGADREEQVSIDVIPVRVDRVVTTFVFLRFGASADGFRESVVGTVIGRLAEQQA